MKVETKKIGVIGAGEMGCGVAIDLSSFGYQVVLIDVSDEKLGQAKDKIKKDIRMYKMMKKEMVHLSQDYILSNIKFSTDYKDLVDLKFIIENVTEKWDIKKEVYKKLKDICKEDVIFAINTSCISITKIASNFSHPEKVIGMHFMNPVPLKSIVETIKGFHTSDKVIEESKEFLHSINKRPVLVNDYPGFVANRLSHLFMNEAAFLVQDQVASPKEIDLIFRQGYNHKMGPLETADLIGLDTVVQSLQVLYESYQDSKFQCCPLLKKMVDAGLLGKKSGKGFYEY